MIRPFTCICMLMAAGSGLYLYQTKHRAQLLDREIARTFKQIDQTKERIGVLKGEWALLNEPERLDELAQQHLMLKALTPAQFVAMADLGKRLPALPQPGAPTPAADDSPAEPESADATPAVALKAAVPPAPLVNRTVQAALPAQATPSRPTLRTLPLAAPPSVVVTALASRSLPPVQPPVLGSRILAPVTSVSAGAIQSGAAHAPAAGNAGETAAQAPHRPPPVVLTATVTAPPPAYTQPVFAQPSRGSALGGAAHLALPPPVPFSTALAGR